MKTKLEVIRLTNEDVVATSGLCKDHPSALHLYTYINNGTPNNNMGVDQYPSGSLTSDSTYAVNYDSFDPELTTSTVDGKWYYFNGTKFEECTGNHDDYTKIIH